MNDTLERMLDALSGYAAACGANPNIQKAEVAMELERCVKAAKVLAVPHAPHREAVAVAILRGEVKP
jgi:hypothetical protein